MAAEFPRGCDFDDYERMIKDGTIVPGTIIRVYNYGVMSTDESHYVVGTRSKLFTTRESSGAEVNPRAILSRKQAEHGWSVEDVSYEALPEGELRKVLGI